MTRFPLTMLAAIALAPIGEARAGTIDTFSFTQDGYVDPNNPGVPGILSGSFTGSVEASGYIALSDLTSFSITYSEGLGQSFGYSASFFSFNTSSASTLDFEAGIGILGYACTGAAAAFGYDHCATAGLPSAANGFALGAYTGNLATVSLVSSIVTIPQPLPIPGPTPYPYPQPVPTSVPEPGSAALFGAALVGLGLVVARSGRRACT